MSSLLLSGLHLPCEGKKRRCVCRDLQDAECQGRNACFLCAEVEAKCILKAHLRTTTKLTKVLYKQIKIIVKNDKATLKYNNNKQDNVASWFLDLKMK